MCYHSSGWSPCFVEKARYIFKTVELVFRIKCIKFQFLSVGISLTLVDHLGSDLVSDAPCIIRLNPIEPEKCGLKLKVVFNWRDIYIENIRFLMNHSAHRVKLWWKKFPNFQQNLSAIVRGW